MDSQKADYLHIGNDPKKVKTVTHKEKQQLRDPNLLAAEEAERKRLREAEKAEKAEQKRLQEEEHQPEAASRKEAAEQERLRALKDDLLAAKRMRKPSFSNEEKRMLLEGVERFGEGRWLVILAHYNFNTCTS